MNSILCSTKLEGTTHIGLQMLTHAKEMKVKI